MEKWLEEQVIENVNSGMRKLEDDDDDDNNNMFVVRENTCIM